MLEYSKKVRVGSKQERPDGDNESKGFNPRLCEKGFRFKIEALGIAKPLLTIVSS